MGGGWETIHASGIGYYSVPKLISVPRSKTHHNTTHTSTQFLIHHTFNNKHHWSVRLSRDLACHSLLLVCCCCSSSSCFGSLCVGSSFKLVCSRACVCTNVTSIYSVYELARRIPVLLMTVRPYNHLIFYPFPNISTPL